MFPSKFARAVRCAARGLKDTVLSQQNFRIQLVLGGLAVLLGFLLGISLTNWCVLVLAIGAVLGSELLNTGIERLADYASDGEVAPLIRKAKDASAAGVLIVSLTAAIIGVLMLIVPLFQRLGDWRRDI